MGEERKGVKREWVGGSKVGIENELNGYSRGKSK